jgi:uncharacterized protein (UPF0297 family)
MKSRKKKSTNIPSLSSSNVGVSKMSEDDIKALNEKVFASINNIELQKSLDRWLKQNMQQNQIVRRDLSILKNSVSEYLESYLLFGYNLEGDRIILQKFDSAKDRDAIMEFLKTIFLKQQNENFLDE